MSGLVRKDSSTPAIPINGTHGQQLPLQGLPVAGPGPGPLISPCVSVPAQCNTVYVSEGQSYNHEQEVGRRCMNGAAGTVAAVAVPPQPQPPQTVGMHSFELLRVIGQGSMGKVIQVQKKGTKEIYAMKIVRKKRVVARNKVTHTMTERWVLQDITHPFIVKLRYAFQTDNKLYMVLDYLNGGDLYFRLNEVKTFSEDNVRFYASEIILALDHLHRNNIVYRDLKPENMLLDSEGHIRLTDFGLSKELVDGQSMARTYCGTVAYMAPEILNRTGHSKDVDWWSLGVLIYEMLCGLPPFYLENEKQMCTKILEGPLRIPNYLSPNAQSLLLRLLNRDASMRLGSGERDAEQVKEHPFFHGVDWDAVFNRQITPPWRPVLTSDTDTSHFDQDITIRTPKDSLVDEEFRYNFEGFTYLPNTTIESLLAEAEDDEDVLLNRNNNNNGNGASAAPPPSSDTDAGLETDQGGLMHSPQKPVGGREDEEDLFKFEM